MSSSKYTFSAFLMERSLKSLVAISLLTNLSLLFLVTVVDPKGTGLQFVDHGFVRFKIWSAAEFQRYRDIASDSLAFFPYIHMWIEYPQFATYLWVLLYLWVGSRLKEFILFHQLVQLPMQVLMSLLVYQISRRFMSEVNAFSSAVVYGLCPLVIFVWFSRYDVIPTFVTMLSISLILRERYSSSFLLLGIGTMMKWYPATLLPAYLVYLAKNKISLKAIVEYVCIFSVTCLIPTLPFLSMRPLEWVMNTLSPLAHLSRGQNQESLPGLIAFLLYRDFEQEYRLSTLFRILHIAGPLSPLLLLPKRREELIGSCTITILTLLTFAKFYSPQWIVWVTPLLLVAIRNRGDWLKFWALQLTVYLQYPVLYLYSWPHNWHWRLGGMWLIGNFAYWLLVGAKFVLFLLFIAKIIVRLKPTEESVHFKAV